MTSPFIEYKTVRLSNLSNIRTTIKEAEYECYFNNIFVCNMSNNADGIRVSLDIESNNPISNNIILLKDFLIKKNVTINLTSEIQGGIFLKPTEKLVIYSSGFTHVFNCVGDYSEYVEDIMSCIQ